MGFRASDLGLRSSHPHVCGQNCRARIPAHMWELGHAPVVIQNLMGSLLTHKPRTSVHCNTLRHASLHACGCQVTRLCILVHTNTLLTSTHFNIHREVGVRLPKKAESNSYGARPVHLIITVIEWSRTSILSIKNSVSIKSRACAPGGSQPCWIPAHTHTPLTSKPFNTLRHPPTRISAHTWVLGRTHTRQHTADFNTLQQAILHTCGYQVTSLGGCKPRP